MYKSIDGVLDDMLKAALANDLRTWATLRDEVRKRAAVTEATLSPLVPGGGAAVAAGRAMAGGQQWNPQQIEQIKQEGRERLEVSPPQWIPWRGFHYGEPPSGDRLIETKLYSGMVGVRPADQWCWKFNGTPDDIMCWRPATPEVNTTRARVSPDDTGSASGVENPGPVSGLVSSK